MQYPEQQRIAGNTLDAEVGFRHTGRQPTGADNFKPVLEDIHLNIGGGTVVAMRQGIDHCFTDGFLRQFGTFLPFNVFDDVLDIDFGENPGHYLINH